MSIVDIHYDAKCRDCKHFLMKYMSGNRTEYKCALTKKRISQKKLACENFEYKFC